MVSDPIGSLMQRIMRIYSSTYWRVSRHIARGEALLPFIKVYRAGTALALMRWKDLVGPPLFGVPGLALAVPE
jgi:hypothetical protein